MFFFFTLYILSFFGGSFVLSPILLDFTFFKIFLVFNFNLFLFPFKVISLLLFLFVMPSFFDIFPFKIESMKLFIFLLTLKISYAVNIIVINKIIVIRIKPILLYNFSLNTVLMHFITIKLEFSITTRKEYAILVLSLFTLL